jgi:hypothetical protein
MVTIAIGTEPGFGDGSKLMVLVDFDRLKMAMEIKDWHLGGVLKIEFFAHLVVACSSVDTGDP